MHRFPVSVPTYGLQLPPRWFPLITHLVARLEIEFVGVARLEVVENDVQIGGQQTVRLLEME